MIFTPARSRLFRLYLRVVYVCACNVQLYLMAALFQPRVYIYICSRIGVLEFFLLSFGILCIGWNIHSVKQENICSTRRTATF